MGKRWRNVNSRCRAIAALLVSALLLALYPQRAFGAEKLICILGGTGTRHAIPVLATAFGLTRFDQRPAHRHAGCLRE